MRDALKRNALLFAFAIIYTSVSEAAILVLPPDRYELADRHRPTNSHSEIRYDGSFMEYLDSVSNIISAHNPNSDVEINTAEGETATVLELIRPFEWRSTDYDACEKENRIGVLLVHGLTDTPFLMRDVGKHFQNKSCYLIRSILLPGHGTRPGDLLKIDDDDWKRATEFGVRSFSNEVSGLYLVGFSTGGGLALNYALDLEDTPQNPAIKGLILFSPAIELSAGFKAVLADWHVIYSWAYKRGKWIDIAPDEDYAKYESFPKNAGDQVFEVTVKRKLLDPRLKVSVFIAISRDDATIDSEATVEYFQDSLEPDVQAKSKLLVYYRSDQIAEESVCSKSNTICRKSDIEEGILSQAHTSIPVSKENFHYGLRGDYYNCIHYIKDMDDTSAAANYTTCKDRDADVDYAENVSGGTEEIEKIMPEVYRRLTFNPDFAGMMELVDEFVIDTAN